MKKVILKSNNEKGAAPLILFIGIAVVAGLLLVILLLFIAAGQQREAEQAAQDQAASGEAGEVSTGEAPVGFDPSTVPAGGAVQCGSNVTAQIPSSGPGVRTYATRQHMYNTPSCLAAMLRFVAHWNSMRPNQNVQFGEASRYGGGHLAPHAEHKWGCDFDLRPIFKPNVYTNGSYQMSHYDQPANIQFVQLAVATFPGIKIFFNDPALIRRFGPRQTQYMGGHHNHYHFSFEEYARR